MASCSTVGSLISGPPPQPISLGAALPIIQPLICYESLFPGFTRAGARRSGKRAGLIVNISNDAWFGVTSGPWQHLNLASYRAIEEGLPVLRATTTGIMAAVRYAFSGPSDAVPYFRTRIGMAAPIRMSSMSFSVFDMNLESHWGRGWAVPARISHCKLPRKQGGGYQEAGGRGTAFAGERWRGSDDNAAECGCYPRRHARSSQHSGVASRGDDLGAGVNSGNFLRGTQTTNAKGIATFKGIYPGWYPARTIHIHQKIWVGGKEVLTTQTFFTDKQNAAVMATAPYNSRGAQRVTNANDMVLNRGGINLNASLMKLTGSNASSTIVVKP